MSTSERTLLTRTKGVVKIGGALLQHAIPLIPGLAGQIIQAVVDIGKDVANMAEASPISRVGRDRSSCSHSQSVKGNRTALVDLAEHIERLSQNINEALTGRDISEHTLALLRKLET